ncbi:MAG: hypothetical protein NC120_12940 [Ruminococcus sp.]|nr:hypothetical protein [Ruminococcus sp.]
MDIKAKIEEISEKIRSDKTFADKFKSDPVSAVESVLGVDLPNDAVNKIIDGVKAKISVGGVKDTLSGLFGKK